MSEVALEKRLNEIRRLEGLKDNLIAALELSAERIEILLFGKNDPQHPWVREARSVIEAAKASKPAS